MHSMDIPEYTPPPEPTAPEHFFYAINGYECDIRMVDGDHAWVRTTLDDGSPFEAEIQADTDGTWAWDFDPLLVIKLRDTHPKSLLDALTEVCEYATAADLATDGRRYRHLMDAAESARELSHALGAAKTHRLAQAVSLIAAAAVDDEQLGQTARTLLSTWSGDPADVLDAARRLLGKRS